MAGGNNAQFDKMPVVADLAQFDSRSGNALERLIFNRRPWLIIICAIITAVLGFQALRLDVNASFEKMIPLSHPYIKNYLANKADLKGLGNSLRIVVENPSGDIYDPKYLAALRRINDAVFLIPGVDRPGVKSLWMPIVRWNVVTERGFAGGPVMPDGFDASAQGIEQLRTNIARANIVGSIVSNDLHSSMIQLPLLDHYADTGKPLDYAKLSHRIDEIIIFESLTEAQIRLIVRLQLEHVARMAKSQDIDLVFDDSIVEQLVLEGYRPEYGARELKRRIRQVIENPLAKEMLDGRIKEGSRISCRFDAEQDSAAFELVAQPGGRHEKARIPASSEESGDSEAGKKRKPPVRKRSPRTGPRDMTP